MNNKTTGGKTESVKYEIWMSVGTHLNWAATKDTRAGAERILAHYTTINPLGGEIREAR